MAATGLCPKVLHESSECTEYDSVGKTVKVWHTWIAPRMTLLHKYVADPPCDVEDTIVRTQLCLVALAQRGSPVSDNALSNFGRFNGNAMLIDAGSATQLDAPIPKSAMKKLWKRFWIHLKWYVAQKPYKFLYEKYVKGCG